LRSDFELIAIRLRSFSAGLGAISRRYFAAISWRFRGDFVAISDRLINAPLLYTNLDINCVVLVLVLAQFRGYLGDKFDHSYIAQDLRCDYAAIAMR
jgi:hypothetical protein